MRDEIRLLQRERVEAIAIRLLVWHIEQGHTLDTVESMIDTPNATHDGRRIRRTVNEIVGQEVTS